jgi:hypothetical protein
MLRGEEERNLERRQDATGNWSGPARQALTISRCLACESPLDRVHDGWLCASYGTDDLRVLEQSLAVRVGKSTPAVEASEVHRCAE